jgi:hypothetical protein
LLYRRWNLMTRLGRSTAMFAGRLKGLLLSGDVGHRSPLRLANSAATRSNRRASRWSAAALALGLGLNGFGFCVCAAQPTPAEDVHSCCPTPPGHHHQHATTGTSVKASVPCCDSQMTSPPVAASVVDRDALRHTVVAAASIRIAPVDPLVRPTIAVSFLSPRNSSPPRTTVLRI